MNGEDDGDRSEVWEFRGDEWIAITSGRPLPADKFTPELSELTNQHRVK